MTQPIVQTQEPVLGGRFLSVDVLRGFVMFVIMGAEQWFWSLNKIGQEGIVGFIAGQLHHVRWAGFRFYDLIFPLFIFVMGTSLVFSMDKILARQGKRAAIRRIIRRSAILFLLGVFANGGGVSHITRSNVLCGVLQRLALCSLLTSLLYCGLKFKGMVATCVTILVGYWALMSFVPVPGVGHVSFDPGTNWAAYVDKLLPPYHRVSSEGWLSTLPAVASCILGVFGGLLLKNNSIPPKKKVVWLIGGGILMTVLGYLWGFQFPVVKRMWTSSYVMVAGGYSYALLGCSYLVVDYWKLRRWTTPLVWIGTNAIFAYLITGVGEDFLRGLAQCFVGGDAAIVLGRYTEFAVTVVMMVLAVALMRFMYQRKIFLRA